jgi:hypothetical protein
MKPKRKPQQVTENSRTGGHTGCGEGPSGEMHTREPCANHSMLTCPAENMQTPLEEGDTTIVQLLALGDNPMHIKKQDHLTKNQGKTGNRDRPAFYAPINAPVRNCKWL